MIKVGLTGGIGSGKSTVARVFSELGIPVFFADFEAKKFLLLPEIKAKLVKMFSDIIIQNGEIDRQKLASIIFNDKKSLKKVNELIHPLVRQRFKEWTSDFMDEDYVIIEVAILFENGFNAIVDKAICVSSNLEDMYKRTMARDNATWEMVNQRMNNQWPQHKVVEHSDFVIFNSDNNLIIPQILAIDKALKKLNLEFK